jgi:parallel beta-helix repeat protein
MKITKPMCRSWLALTLLSLLLATSACSNKSGAQGKDENLGGASSGGEGSGGAPTGTGGALVDGGTGGTGEPVPVDAPPSCDEPEWDEADFNEVYDVGPGFDLETPSDVPWESIGPGTLVRIHRRATPYTDKWVLAVTATEEEPVVVLGVPEDGLLPEIQGAGAATRTALSFWSEQRGVIKVGGSSVPDVETAEHIVIECLDISGAREENSFTDDGGNEANYADNASAIFLESGRFITIRNNRIHDSGNGLFIANATYNTHVSGNHIFDNGNVDSIYEHNAYTEGHGIVYEFNRFDPLCEGCPGSNLKDRSSGLVVRFNWIDGGNRALDIVDSSYESIRNSPDYDDTFVYGNIMIEPNGGNRQLVHYGGDNSAEYFRTGTLHFYHNTVVSERDGLFSVVRLSSADATADIRNNIFFALGGGSQVAILEDAGTAVLMGNWLPTGWNQGSPSLTGDVTESDNVTGDDPDFVDVEGRNFTLTGASTARGITAPLHAGAAGYGVTFQYDHTGQALPRSQVDAAGALE